jgi:AraC-like DNA-binding protein
MGETLRGADLEGLERSCAAGRDAIRCGVAAPGLEWADVRLTTCAYAPHRHDTYAIGVTLAGVQTFRYRGERRVCLPGEVHVLHPDETHDGAPGTDAGFAYRIVYVEPGLVRGALGDRALPFVADPVPRLGPATAALAALLADVDDPADDLRKSGLATAIADALQRIAGDGPADPGAVDRAALERVREHLAANAAEAVPAAALERIAGLDRFTLARQFRRAYGTSPDRYRTLRRLALARAAILRGEPLAEAAAGAGFADQSHLTRQFRRAYGLTPGRFARAVAAGGATAGRAAGPSRAARPARAAGPPAAR